MHKHLKKLGKFHVTEYKDDKKWIKHSKHTHNVWLANFATLFNNSIMRINTNCSME